MKRREGWGNCVPEFCRRSMLRTLALRLLPVGWFVAWVVCLRPGVLRPQIVSGLSIVFGTIGVFAGLYLFFRGFRLLAWKRSIEDTPLTKIGAAAVGQVKVSGRAVGPYTLISPVAGAECYYYRAVARDGREAQNDDQFEGRVTEAVFAPFFVEDETGSLMVDPRGALLELPAEFDGRVSGNSSADGSRRFLQRHGISTQGETTVTEHAIKPGDSLLVLGCLGENRGLGSMVNSSRRTGIYLSREAAELQRQEQLEALGISNDELPIAGTGAELNPDQPPRMILGAGDGHQPFVLSRETPQRMIDDLARRSTLDIWAGPVLTLLSLGLVVKWLGVW